MTETRKKTFVFCKGDVRVPLARLNIMKKMPRGIKRGTGQDEAEIIRFLKESSWMCFRISARQCFESVSSPDQKLNLHNAVGN